MRIVPGDLVKLVIENSVSPENLTLSPSKDSSLTLYEKIDLSTFPSYRDFKGYSKNFEGETFLVIKKKGRPWSFKLGEKWSMYDVYQVMYCNTTFDCFEHCLKKIEN